MSFWQDRTVLVTGATGYVGGALAARLVQEGALVTGTGRNLQAAGQLEALGVRLRALDLRDDAGMAALLQDQATVFHSAAWLSRRHGPDALADEINVAATERLVQAAAHAGAERFVHVSSIAVYGPPLRRIYDETVPVSFAQPDAYGRTKAMGEARALALAADLGLPLAVARPGMIYGPGSRAWAVVPLSLVQKGTPVVLERGDGHAQPVFLDNLIDGLLLLGSQAGAVGQAFNFVDEPLAWGAYFGYFGRMCGRRPRGLPLLPVRLLAELAGRLGVGPRLLRPDMLSYYTSEATYPATLARQRLGYLPSVGLDEGMRRVEAWFRASGYLPAELV